MSSPVYVDPFLGAGGTWLHLLDPALTPPVSWMGGKRRLAPRLLELLDLHPGQRVQSILGDASWWGWVWPLCLDPVTGPVVCRWLRSWRGEEPRALWFRLRDAGPPADPVERAAGLLWLQARAASGVPVWWEGDEPALVQDRGWKSPTCSTRKVWTAVQGNATEPRLLAGARSEREAEEPRDAGQCGASRLLASNGHGGVYAAGHKQVISEMGQMGGMQDPGTIAERLDQTRARLVQWAGPGGRVRPNAGKGFNAAGAGGIVDPGTVAARVEAARVEAVIEHRDALDLIREWAPVLGARARIYLDPPYQGATGYPVTCPREHVLAIAEESGRHGGRVVLSEAVGLAGELGPGWRDVCLRRAPKPEWVTVYGCGAAAEHGRLFAGGAA